MTTPHPSTLNVSEALGLGLKYFTRQWVAWTGSCAIVIGSIFVLVVSFQGLLSVLSNNDPAGSGYRYDGGISPSENQILLAYILTGIVIVAALAFVYLLNAHRQAYLQSQGEKITIRGFFRLKGLEQLFVVGICYHIIVSIGSVMCYVPGIIAAGFLMYLMPAAAANPNEKIGTIFSKAIDALKNNLGSSVALYLVLSVALLSSIFTYVGLIAAIPISYLAMMVGYLMCEKRSYVVPD